MVKMIEAYHEEPVVQVFMLFIQTARLARKYSDMRFFQALGLSTVKYIALKALAHNDGVLSHSKLAVWTDTKRHNISTLVKRMEIEGLVTTRTSNEDRRFTMVELTDKGRDLLSQADVVGYDLIKKAMSGIDKQKAVQLDRILRILRDSINTASKDIVITTPNRVEDL